MQKKPASKGGKAKAKGHVALRDLPAKVKQVTAVRGGSKHIAGVKYE